MVCQDETIKDIVREEIDFEHEILKQNQKDKIIKVEEENEVDINEKHLVSNFPN